MMLNMMGLGCCSSGSYNGPQIGDEENNAHKEVSFRQSSSREIAEHTVHSGPWKALLKEPSEQMVGSEVEELQWVT